MSRRRPLSDEEEELWTGIARSITPLRPAKVPAKSSKSSPADKEASPAMPRPVVVHPDKSPSAKSPPLAPFDRRFKQRVARGREPIEARIDLHGLTQTQAHTALLRFLRHAQADGVKIALIVTGKGARDSEHGGSSERGVLKRQVPMWLSLPEFRPLVVGIEDAHAFHGGQGALYVRIRRVR
jgi:DNA-nicking Smr family endonuclease